MQVTKIATGKKMENEFSYQTSCHKLEYLNILNAPTTFFLVSWLSTDFTDAAHVCVALYSDICIYIHRLGQYLGLKILISVFLRGFQKSEYFWMCEIFGYFWGSPLIGLHIFV